MLAGRAWSGRSGGRLRAADLLIFPAEIRARLVARSNVAAHATAALLLLQLQEVLCTYTSRHAREVQVDAAQRSDTSATTKDADTLTARQR